MGNRKSGPNHGFSDSPEYESWIGMKKRCSQHPGYVGRIFVCERWLNSFEAFYADMGPKPSPKYSIERNNNDGDYTPNNCCWATRKEQSNNRRGNRFFFNGYTVLTLTEVAQQHNIRIPRARWLFAEHGVFEYGGLAWQELQRG